MISTDCFPGFSTGTATCSVAVVPGHDQHPDTLETTTTGWVIEEYVPDRGRVIAAPGPVSLSINVDVGQEMVSEGFRPWAPAQYEYRTCQPTNRWIAGTGLVKDEFERLVRWQDIHTEASESGNLLVSSIPMRQVLGLNMPYPQFHYLTSAGWVASDAIIVPSGAGLTGQPKALEAKLPVSAILVCVLDKAAQISQPKGIMEFSVGDYAIRADVLEGRSLGLSVTTNAWSTAASSSDLVYCGSTGMVVTIALWYGDYEDPAHGSVKEAHVGIKYGASIQPAVVSESTLTLWQTDWLGFEPVSLSIGSPFGTGMAVLEAAVFSGYDWRQIDRQSSQLVSYYMNRRHYAI